MHRPVINEVIRFSRASTSRELIASLAALPHGVHFGVIHDLDEKGRAHRYDSSAKCAYYLRRDEHDILVWTWAPIASHKEALRLIAMVAALSEPLTEEQARRLFAEATSRGSGFQSLRRPDSTGSQLLKFASSLK